MYEFSVTGEGIVYGCTDLSALNYDANAESIMVHAITLEIIVMFLIQ